jgi:hypothetical protein
MGSGYNLLIFYRTITGEKFVEHCPEVEEAIAKCNS